MFSPNTLSGLPNPNPNPTSNHTIPSPTPSQVREGFGGQLLRRVSCGVSATLQLAVFGSGGFGHVLERVVLSPEP